MLKTSDFSACYCGRTVCIVTALLLAVSVLATRVCGQDLAQLEDSPKETVFARTGDTVILPCNQSVPTPTPVLPVIPFFLQWRRLDLPYPFYIGFSTYPPYIDTQYAGRVTIGDDLSLQIDSLLPEDDGWYECQVIVLNGNYNDIGNGTFIHLTIIGPPRFLTTPPALVVFHQGKTDRLQCVAKGTPTPTVTWLKDGRPLTSNHIVTTVSSIEFEGVRQDDGGTYVCTAESEEGAVQHTVRLLVHGAPFIFIPPLNLTIESDQVAILECEAEASPDNVTQRWYYQDRRIESVTSLRGRYAFLPEGGLMVQMVRPADEGWYSCSPTNGLGSPPIARGYLDVQYRAYVVAMPTNAYIPRGLDVTLTCTADADPPLLNVKWYKASTELIALRSNRYSISDEGSLTIAGAELNDSGPYTCAPYNKIGTAGVSSATLLTVRDPPEFLTRPKSQYQRMLGEEVAIPCSASGDPNPTISWAHVNGKLPQFRSTTSQSSLMIRGLTKEDHGIYRCLATNEIATVVSTTQLIIELTSPHEPYNVSVVTTISSARVAWRPAYNGGYTQTYTVWYRQQGRTDEDWCEFDKIPEDVNFYLISGLEPSTDYQFGVLASNQLGDSLLSEVVTAQTKDPGDIISPTDETGRTLIPIYIGLIPSPPQNLTITPTQEGLVLAWRPPAVWGHFVDRYSIEYRLQGPWVVLYDRVDGGELERILGKLQPNTTYQFRMFAFTPALFSSPSEVVTGFTGDILAYIPPSPTTGITQYGEPGILAGVIAAICFLLVTLLLSMVAICLSYRRKRRKRLAFFSVAAQTPQPLIHRSPQTQSPETPLPVPVKQPTGIVSKLIVKISPKHKLESASAPHPNRQAHLTSNGKLPNGGHAEPSLSERLLGRSLQRPGAQKVDEDYSRRRMGNGGRPRRLASEQALELEEFEPSAGVYSVRDGRIRSHSTYNYDRSHPHNSVAPSENGFDEDIDDAPLETEGSIPPGLQPLNSDASHPVRGDYVYYHGEMFITSNSEDNEDYVWASDLGTDEGGGGGGGVVNPALDVDEGGAIASRRPPPAQNHYVDMPMANTWRWDRDWADDTLSHTDQNIPRRMYRDTPHHARQQSIERDGTLPRQSTRKDIRRLSRDDFDSGPPPEYRHTPPWSDSISTIQGNSPITRHPDYHRTDYEEQLEATDYKDPRLLERSPERQASPHHRKPRSSVDCDKLRNSPHGRSSPRRQSPDDSSHGRPVHSSRSPERHPSPHRQGAYDTYKKPLPSKRSPEGPSSPYHNKGNYLTYDRTKMPQKGDDYARTINQNSLSDPNSSSNASKGFESGKYRKPVEQVMKHSPVRSELGSHPRAGHSGAPSTESYADTDTLQGTFRDADPTIIDDTDDRDEVRHSVNDSASPSGGAIPKKHGSALLSTSPVGGSKPKIYERVSPQGGSRSKIYDDLVQTPESTHRTKHSSLSPGDLYIDMQTKPKDRNRDVIPLHPYEGSTEPSLSPTTTHTNSRASVSSVDSRPGSTKPIPLPQSYISAQRSLLSPNSQCSASSGYASRNTSQSASSRGRTSSVPSIHDPAINSPFSDSAGPFSNVSSKESAEDPYYEFDPMLRETDLLDALKKYYQPVEIRIPKDEVYEEETEKVADMDKRCEKLKREFQEYQRRQAKARLGTARLTSSV